MVEYMTLASGLVSGGLAGAVYAALWYNRNRLKGKKATGAGETFDQSKFIATLTVGALVGLGLAYGGVEPTTANIAETFPIYVGTITLVEAILKSVRDSADLRGITPSRYR